MSEILTLLKTLGVLLPFILLAILNAKNNLKKQDRSRQCYMPIVAILFSLVVGFVLGTLSGWIVSFFHNLGGWIYQFGDWVSGLFDGALAAVGTVIQSVAGWVEDLIATIDIAFWAQILVNALIVVIYLLFKRIVITFMKGFCKPGKAHYEAAAKLAYAKQEDGNFYVKDHMAQGITLMKTLYYFTFVFGVIGTMASVLMVNLGLFASLYYPVFGVIMIGELYFFLDGPRWTKEETTLSGEAERSTKICDYTFMRQVLSRNFGDKILSDNTSVNSDLLHFKTNSELIDELIDNDETAVEAYGLFMKKKAATGLEIDQNYLASGLEILKGKSVIFNNPFYYDLCPYIFFPMNRTILRRKKVLIVLGRHAIEKDIAQWCEDGLMAVTNIPGLWNIGVLGSEATNPDVGIVTRSSVHDLRMHENNAEFFKDVEFVMLVEPSRLIATAQIGLNSLIRHCRRDGKKLVFCSADKNCDGLVDALSHILMTSLEQVTATNKHKGTNSYMCWEADEEHLQHRMLPNLSHYLGVGTELSFMALKNQISKTAWYGGDAFPVTDMHWVAKQYYYDLLHFASLPAVQSTFDEVFNASANMWSATVQENSYITVEDESFNMYEAKRAFSTRAKNQGFINVISTDYLLKDYMAANDGIFDADSKAIPYIVADYAHTERNVIYRICLRLTTYPLLERDIRGELALINVDLGEDMTGSLWGRICKIAHGGKNPHFDPKTGEELLCIHKNGKEYTFRPNVIESELKYSVKTGCMETVYSIKDPSFVEAFLSDLCSAEYVAEDETDKNRFLGTELRGHIFQKYLPGQFFTFGGKYYEMLRLTLDGRVIVRRAADHINGRPQYRQVRNYRLSNVVDSTLMGDCRNMGSFSMTKQVADIEVETPAYWRMRRYNDFKTGVRIDINGVPCRQYLRKQLLRIDFPDALITDERTLPTVALLMNEVFRTLYAENQGMIVAVTPGQAEAPITYSLDGEVRQNSIYIIEDSQMDIGFLVSVERNVNRILSTVCDYLQWHTTTLEASLTPPPAPDKNNYVLTDEQRAQEEAEAKEAKKQKGVRGFFRKIGGFFGTAGKKIGGFFKMIGRFFKKIGMFFVGLFKRKPKNPEEPKPEDAAVEGVVADTPDGATEAPQKPEKKKRGWFRWGKKNKDAEEQPAEPEDAQDPDAVTDPDLTTEDDGAVPEAAQPEKPEKKKRGWFWWARKGKKDEAAEADTADADAPAEDAQETVDDDADAKSAPDDDLAEAPADDFADEPADDFSDEPADDFGDEPADDLVDDLAEEDTDDLLNDSGSQLTRTSADDLPDSLADEAEEEDADSEHPVLMNIAPPKKLYSMAPPSGLSMPAEDDVVAEDIPVDDIAIPEEQADDLLTEEPAAEDLPDEDLLIGDDDLPAEDQLIGDDPLEEIPAEDVPMEDAPAEPDGTAAETPAEGTVEADGATPEQPKDLARKPYHERYYLLYGGEEEPQSIQIGSALDLLQHLGFGKGSLEQARNGMSEADNVERSFTPDRKGSHYCDFCGTELFGSEYEVLQDGRERCMICGRTAVKTEKEFKKIYEDVIRNLSIFFGISITAPVKIQMVNAKKLHKHLGKAFVPTGEADGRVLGVAIKDKKTGYSILLENGSPRLSATMTMVHELTHIWQYLNWDAKKIKHLYGSKQNLEIYEGMSKWVEIQYAYLINETQTAKREEILTRLRDDPYGHGFVKYADVYPLSTGSRLLGETPFSNPEKPL